MRQLSFDVAHPDADDPNDFLTVGLPLLRKGDPAEKLVSLLGALLEITEPLFEFYEVVGVRVERTSEIAYELNGSVQVEALQHRLGDASMTWPAQKQPAFDQGTGYSGGIDPIT